MIASIPGRVVDFDGLRVYNVEVAMVNDSPKKTTDSEIVSMQLLECAMIYSK